MNNILSNLAKPVPQGLYVPAVRMGNMIFTAGMTPRIAGELVSIGTVNANANLETYQDAVVLACANALGAAEAQLLEGERLSAILSLTVFIATDAGFSAHSKLADFASEYLQSKLGSSGIGVRAAVGVATLPSNATFEIQLIAIV